MGYTHYFKQTKRFTSEEWDEVNADVGEILKYVENGRGIALANGMGDTGTRPEFWPVRIQFNGVGDDAHETFEITRELSSEFCKTARKPYDLAVCACLCYLSSVQESHFVTSDGHGRDFLAGLEAAKRALPRLANILDLPMGVMQSDRWRMPWISHEAKGYEVRFCVDGFGYVLKGSESYRFESHCELALFLDKNKEAAFRRGGGSGRIAYGNCEPDIWNATGGFDQARRKRLARAQAKVLAPLFPPSPEHAHQPPAFVRPDALPSDDAPRFSYYREMLKEAQAA